MSTRAGLGEYTFVRGGTGGVHLGQGPSTPTPAGVGVEGVHLGQGRELTELAGVVVEGARLGLGRELREYTLDRRGS